MNTPTNVSTQQAASNATAPATSTRERVRTAVSEHGPVTAAELGQRMNLTPAAMRRHLDALLADGLIAEREAPTTGARRRGRPARAYVLTEAGHGAMPDGYDALASQVIEHLIELGGEQALVAVAQERARELAHSVRPAVEAAGDDPDARADALARALSRQGFAASTRPVAEGTPLAGVQLCQGHCPVQHVAASHPEFCEAERAAFSEVLGVHVQRLASLAHGDHVCTTFIPTPAVPRAQDTGPPGPHAAPGETRHFDTPDQTDAHQKKEQR